MRPLPRRGRAAVAATALLLLAGCSAGADTGAASPRNGDDPARHAHKQTGDGHGGRTPDPASVRADELGAVPVLMYHQIVSHPQSVYDRTPQDLRAELERLAREHYVPVTAHEFSTGHIDIPAGTHPVVLTFDDSSVSQFHLDDKGRPARGTAVAILQDVAREHPRFRATATFFVNVDPFGVHGGRKPLHWLATHGFEIGNHTLHHTSLGTVDDAAVQRAVAANQKAIAEAVPDVEVHSLALPNGSMPDNRKLALKGASDGMRYSYEGVYLVGANPAPSPFAGDFDANAIPRIRSGGPEQPDAGYTSDAWLDKLADGSVPRYTSDGDPDRVSFPKAQQAKLDDAHRKDAHPY
jgi:peptidoglycan/xylan/chitin deacetylase (PgdA/CDA1 family)